MKKIIFYGVILLLIASLTTTVILLLDDNDQNQPLVNIGGSNQTYILGTINRGTIQQFQNISGMVKSDQEAKVQTLRIAKDQPSEILVAVGDAFQIGQPLYRYQNQTYPAPVNGRVTEILQHETEILLQYVENAGQYIIAQVPADIAYRINGHTKIEIHHFEQVYRGQIVYMANEIKDGLLEIKVVSEQLFFVGTEVIVSMILAEKSAVLIVSKQFIIEEIGKYYILIVDRKDAHDVPILSKKQVILGIDNGISVEIVSPQQIPDGQLVAVAR